MSEYEKKRNEAASNAYPISRDGEYFDLKFQQCFKAGSDFGREYNKTEYNQLMQELEWYKDKFETAAHKVNDYGQRLHKNKLKYSKLMQDARALADALRIASGASEVAGLRTLEDIIDNTLRNFDKKYPQLNEKEYGL